MHYVCIENNLVVSVLNYQPNVPNTVSVTEITDSQAAQIAAQTHYFDVVSQSVPAVAASIAAAQAQYLANGLEREFLNSTDWQVLRHIRQLALSVPTSLSAEQYLQLEQQRHAASARIT